MESCTGGLIGTLLSDQAGASSVVPGGFFTYSNEAKERAGVPGDVIREHGVYSLQTAGQMAKTCRDYYKTDIGIGVTGTLGTIDPNNTDSEPGEVYVAISFDNEYYQEQLSWPGQLKDRWTYRMMIAYQVACMLSDVVPKL